MKTFTIALGFVLIASLPVYSQAHVTFAAPSGYKLKVAINSQTQEDDQYVRFENLTAGDYTTQITATTGGVVYNLRSNITLPDNYETSYFIIVVNKTAQIHWSNEAALTKQPPVATNDSDVEDSDVATAINRGNGYSLDYNSGYRYQRQSPYDRNRSYNQPYAGYRNNWTGNSQCNSNDPYPVLTPAEASSLKVAIQQTPFDVDKIDLIQTALRRANIMTTDVRDLLRLIHFDSNRLKLARQIYEYTCDKHNYYLVTSTFDFPANARQLHQFLQAVR